MNWSDYENEIFSFFSSEYSKADVRRNVLIEGRYSKTKRQVDILIEDYVAGTRFRIVVDGKFFTEKVDVREVETFIGMLNDVEAHQGLLITRKGFTQAAINRAYYDPLDVELDILNFSDLKLFQGFCAIPYAGDNGVVIPAPFGWVIDGTRRQGCVATLYQRGLTLEEAGLAKQWMYINFWAKDENAKTLDELISLQEKKILLRFPTAKFSYQNTIKREDARTAIRKIDIPSYPTPEYTGFAEFKDFIFFCVLFTPEELAKKNLRKLEYIIAKALPVKVKNNTAADTGKTKT